MSLLIRILFSFKINKYLIKEYNISFNKLINLIDHLESAVYVIIKNSGRENEKIPPKFFRLKYVISSQESDIQERNMCSKIKQCN